MTKLTRLKWEATESAHSRGHTLQPWTHRGNRTVAYTSCFDCGRGAYVTATPFPNEAEIMGQAVAVNCYRPPR